MGRVADWTPLAACVALPLLAVAAPAQERLLVPCLGLAADQSPVFSTELFPDPTTEVSACFRLGAADTVQRLTAVFIAENVGAAAPPDYPIVEAELDLKGEKQGRFRFENPRPMPLGLYRVEVSADGRPWLAARYAIAAPSEDAAQAGELMPLAAGRRWTYRFEQRAGAGARIDVPEIEPDAAGLYRATVTIEVIAEEEAGFHLVTSRNGQPVFEEWWRRGEDGVLATRRKDGEQVIELDPPQRLVGTADGERQWTYPPFAQTFRMWGPFPMKGEWGEGRGHVVLASQPAGLVTITAERHFVAGIGMVREIIIQALAGRMMSRQELDLIRAEP